MQGAGSRFWDFGVRRFGATRPLADIARCPTLTVSRLAYQDRLPGSPELFTRLCHLVGSSAHRVLFGSSPLAVTPELIEEATLQLDHGITPMAARVQGAIRNRFGNVREYVKQFGGYDSVLSRRRTPTGTTKIATIAKNTGVSFDWLVTGIEVNDKKLSMGIPTEVSDDLWRAIEEALCGPIDLCPEGDPRALRSLVNPLGEPWSCFRLLTAPDVDFSGNHLAHAMKCLDRAPGQQNVMISHVAPLWKDFPGHPGWRSHARCFLEGKPPLVALYWGDKPRQFVKTMADHGVTSVGAQ